MFGMQSSKIQSNAFQLGKTIGKTDHLLCGSFFATMWSWTLELGKHLLKESLQIFHTHVDVNRQTHYQLDILDFA
jgi:hypothetical protein